MKLKVKARVTFNNVLPVLNLDLQVPHIKMERGIGTGFFSVLHIILTFCLLNLFLFIYSFILVFFLNRKTCVH